MKKTLSILAFNRQKTADCGQPHSKERRRSPFRRFFPTSFHVDGSPVALILTLLVLLVASNGKAQNPGGVATAPAVWYKAESVTPTTWTDVSLNALNLTAAGTITVSAGDAAHNFNTWTTGYSSGTYSTNYYNYLGTNYSVFGDYDHNSYSYMPLTVFGVARATSVKFGAITCIDNELNNGAEPGALTVAAFSNLYPRFYRSSYVIDKTATTRPVTLNQTAIYKVQPYPGGVGASPGNLIMGLDGKDTTIANTNGVSSVEGSHLKIGSGGYDFGGFPGDIQEVAWYKSVLNVSDMQKVETYFSLKFGTTLAHDYVAPSGNTLYSLTANSGYTSNIAGLGRDRVNGNLDQRQSNSVNTGVYQVLISTTGLANTNAGNTVDLSADGQYLVWGDNGLPRLFSVAISGAGSTNYRLKTVWKVSNTGGVGTVRVAWPAVFSNLTLLQNSDPTFASGNTATNMSNMKTVNGTTYNYADVTLADGQYFTFAAKVNAPGGVVQGLSHWYRADIGVINTGNNTDATSWTDQFQGIVSGKLGNNALPEYKTGSATYFNFNPGINFTSNYQSLGNITVQTLTNRCFDIYTLTQQGLSGGRIFNVGINNRFLTGENWDSPGLNASGTIDRRDSARNIISSASVITPYFFANTPSIMYNHFTDTSVNRGLNGAAPGTPFVTSHAGLMYGGHMFGQNGGTATGGDDVGLMGSIGELIVFGDDTITAQQRNRVDAYLAMKYGVTLDNSVSYLSSNSTTVWDKTANAAYYHNVIGIARDDMSALNQQISTSQTTPATDIVTIGTDANSTGVNGSHTAVSADQSFFMVGNDQGSITANASFTYKSLSFSRMQRVWKAQYTNYAQAAYITVPTASLTAALGTPPASNVYVLVSADDAGFTTNVLVTTLSTNGANSYGSITPSGSTGTRYFSFALVSNILLPVTLLDFNATPSNGSVVLDWRTATEVNNKGFAVQRSTDGTVFATLGFVDSKLPKGTGQGADYTYTDRNVGTGSYYYRLLQTDLDGNTALSNTVPVYLSGNGDGLRLSPNPVNDVATVAGLEAGKTVVVVSMDGRVVKSFIATSSVQQVYVKDLASGVYILKTTVNNTPASIKFVVK